MKTPISYYGGKQRMLGLILPLIPEHQVYIEPFFGGGAVFFAKPPSQLEVINDRNDELINFYRVASSPERFAKLKELVDGTIHSRASYKAAETIYTYPTLFEAIHRAWALWTLSRQSFGSSIGKSWGYGKQNDSSGKRLDNAKLVFDERITQRLARVTIDNDDAVAVVKRFDGPEAFHYCDPPYFNSDCGHYAGYSESDFRALLEALAAIEGRFLLSCYPSEVLSDYAARYGWHVDLHELGRGMRTTTKGKTKVEVLVRNYEL